MDKDEIITSIKEEAIKNKVPILQDISLDFIKLILSIKKPKNIRNRNSCWIFSNKFCK